MNITFPGGTETATGSRFLVETGQTRVLVDCGLEAGPGVRIVQRDNYQVFVAAEAGARGFCRQAGIKTDVNQGRSDQAKKFSFVSVSRCLIVHVLDQ